jgi:hypothetical protein
MTKPTTRPPPSRRGGVDGRPSGDSLSEFMPTLEELEILVSDEEAAKRRPSASRVAAARAVMLGAEPMAEQVRHKSPWAKAATEAPIDKAALPSANAPATDTPAAVAPVTAPIGAPEGRRKGRRGLPPWAFPMASAAVVLGPLVTWLIVRNVPPRQTVEVPAASTSVHVTAPVPVDSGASPSVQSSAPVPVPSAPTTTSAAPTVTAPKPEGLHVAPKRSHEPDDPYGSDAAVKSRPAVPAVPAVTEVAPPTTAPAPSTPAPPKSASPPPGPTPMFDPRSDTEKEHGS